MCCWCGAQTAEDMGFSSLGNNIQRPVLRNLHRRCTAFDMAPHIPPTYCHELSKSLVSLCFIPCSVRKQLQAVWQTCKMPLQLRRSGGISQEPEAGKCQYTDCMMGTGGAGRSNQARKVKNQHNLQLPQQAGHKPVGMWPWACRHLLVWQAHADSAMTETPGQSQ